MSGAKDCLFCKIVAGDIAGTVVHETPNTVAIRDIDPQAPTHVLVVPRRHVATLAELTDAAPEELVEVMRSVADVARREGLEGGYRVVVNTGREAGQMVFHAHVHVLGGRSMAWPPG
jgi:histidine triad (HIT) family protein